MQEIIIQMLIPVAGSLATLLLGIGVKFAKDYVEKIENDNIRNVMRDVINEAEYAAIKAVEYSEESFVKQLKKEGNFTPEMGKMAMQKAKKAFLNTLSDRSLNFLKNQTDNFDEWLEEFIEAKLHEHKNLRNITDPKS